TSSSAWPSPTSPRRPTPTTAMPRRVELADPGSREGWELLPLRFERFDDDVLLTNLVGEHLFIDADTFSALTSGRLADEATLRRLRSKHFIRRPSEDVPVELLALKLRTRYRRLPHLTGLHIFVVTLRCDHSCPYCQVSR